jgi:hypothetical protein
LYISVGSDLTKIDDNTFKIYTSSDLDYNSDTGLISDNEKEIGLLWYNKDEEGRYLGFSDGYSDNTFNQGSSPIKKSNGEAWTSYDELEYLKLSKADARLTMHIGKDIPTDETGLTL